MRETVLLGWEFFIAYVFSRNGHGKQTVSVQIACTASISEPCKVGTMSKAVPIKMMGKKSICNRCGSVK
jgi:hypothetical protein